MQGPTGQANMQWKSETRKQTKEVTENQRSKSLKAAEYNVIYNITLIKDAWRIITHKANPKYME